MGDDAGVPGAAGGTRTRPAPTAAATPPAVDGGGGEYDAFISYSHAVDDVLAAALHTGLQRFAKPWTQFRAVRVFRDTTNLAAGPALWSAIEQALERSTYFLLLASPEAARSQWVAREVAWWLAHRPLHTLLIVLTDGELAWDDASGDFDWKRTTSLPEVLRGVLREEPRHVDLRWTRTADQVSRADPRFLDAIADLAAPLRNKPKDELIGQDVLEYRRNRILLRAVIAALTVLVLAATTLAVVAMEQRNDVRRQTDLAERRALQVESARLAAKAADLSHGKPALGLLTALDALRVAPTSQARRTLLALIGEEPRRVSILPANHEILAMARSPDATVLAMALGQGRVSLWDLQARRPLRVLENPDRQGGTVVAFSPDSGTIATDATGGAVALWDAAAGRLRRVLAQPGGPHPVYEVAFSRDGRVLTTVLGPRPPSIQLGITRWDVRTGNAMAAQPPTVYGPFSGANAVAFTPDGETIVAASQDETLDIIGVRAGPVLRTKPLPVPLLETVAVSPDGRVAAAAGPDFGASRRSGIVLVDLDSGRPLGSPWWVDGTVSALQFSADGRTLGVGVGDGRVAFWDTARPGVASSGMIVGHVAAVRALSLGAGDQLASGGKDGTAILWEPDGHTGLQQRLQHPPSGGGTAATVDTVAFDGHGRLLTATASRMSLWDYDGRELAGDLPRPDVAGGSVSGAALSPDGRRIAGVFTTDSGSSIVVWDTETRTIRKTAAVERATAGAVAFSPDGRRVAIAGIEEVLLWDVEQQDTPRRLNLPNGRWLFDGPGPTRLAFSPDGRRLAAGGWGVAVWEVQDPLRPVSTSKAVWVSSVAFSADGTTLAAGDTDGAVDRFTLRSPLRSLGRLPTLTDHTRAVLAVAYSRQGLLASSAEDGTVLLHDAAGEIMADTRQPDRLGSGLGFSPDGGNLLVGTREAVILLDVDPDSWRAYACAVVGPLARYGEGQWARYRGLC